MIRCTSCEIQRPTIVDKNTAGNIVASEDAKTLPVAESPTPIIMETKASAPRMQKKLARSCTKHMNKTRRIGGFNRECATHMIYILSDTLLEAFGAGGKRMQKKRAATN